MRILGIDPGLARVGYGVIDFEAGQQRMLDCGMIRTDPGRSEGDRMVEIAADLRQLLRRWQPDLAAVEKFFFYRSSTTISVVQARGVLIMTLARFKVPVVEFPPMQIKLALAGHGHADKADVLAAVMRELNLSDPPRPDDAADALAVALTGWFQRRPRSTAGIRPRIMPSTVHLARTMEGAEDSASAKAIWRQRLRPLRLERARPCQGAILAVARRELLALLPPGTRLGLYWPLAGESDLRALADLPGQGPGTTLAGRLALPAVAGLPGQGHLEYRAWQPGERLELDLCRIPAPRGPALAPSQLGLVLVQALRQQLQGQAPPPAWP